MKNILMVLWITSSSFAWGAKVTDEKKAFEILTKLQKAWNKTTTYQTQFKQVVFSKSLGTRTETKGVLSVSKPGKLRWESETDGIIQIVNGKRLINIQPNQRKGINIVDQFEDFKKNTDSMTLTFLSGDVDFKKLYVPSLVAEQKDRYELKLKARSESSGESFVAEIDKGSYFLLALTTETADSRARVEFVNTKTNLKLEAKLFEYKPKPTDVVHKQ